MKLSKKYRNLMNNEGFTLMEMLIVIALIGLIGTFVTTNVISRFQQAKVNATRIQIKNLGTILNDYKRDCNYYPSTEQGMDALIQKPAGGPECRGYNPDGYLTEKKAPRDGFNNDFVYTSDGRTYELKSLGADNKEGGEGNDKDISSNDTE